MNLAFRQSSKSTPLVSVIIPAYNAESCLARALDSALAQTYPCVEVVVVDDGSTDRTSEVLHRYEGRLKAVQQANQGAGAARNAGIRSSKGEYVAFLDADDEWLPDKLAEQIAAMEGDRTAALCYTDGAHYNATGMTVPSHASLRRPHRGRVLEALFVENFVITSSVLVRRECLDAVGHFNPRYLNAQDYDLWMRLALKYHFLYVPEVLVRYWSVAQSLSKNIDRLYAMDFEISGRIIKENPGLFRTRRGIVRARFGSLHFRYGWRLFQNGRIQDARREFAASLRFRPTDFRTVGYWCATFLPGQFVDVIRRVRRARVERAH